MISSLPTPLDCVAILLALFFLKTFISHRKRKLPLPPGPRGWPILGNILDIPRSLSWVRYKDLGEKYGGIMSFSIAGQTIVVINSIRIAKELLDRRGQTWSDRPAIPLIHLMEVDSWNVVMKPNNHAHRLERRIVDQSLRPSALAAYNPTQTYRVHEMLRAFLHTPENFVHHIDYMLTGIILSVAYGYDLKRADDPYLAKSRALNSAIVASVGPSASLVNIFPTLRFLPTWFPYMGRARDVPQCRQLGQEIQNEPFNIVKEEIRHGTAKPSLARDNLLAHGDMDMLSEDEQTSIKNVAGTLYEAAVDTTGTLLAIFILVQILYPEVQRRARAQLDSVVGRERLPGLQDRDSLPYIEAMCMELIRWRLASPLGIPHSTSVDDVYEGYFIPKGSMIIANSWAMLHDPKKYPDPESFIPERFLTPSGQLKEDPDLTVAFGFGKRICPGRFLASSITFITVASVLSTFNIGHAKDEAGIEVPVNGEFTIDSGMLSVPLPFRCSITPRDEKAATLIKLTTETEI